MKIAVIGPIATAGIVPFLDAPPPPDFPIGYSGAPFMNTLIGQLLQNGHEVCAITAGGYPATRESKPVSLQGPRFAFHCCPSRRHAVRPSAGRLGRIVDFFAYERNHIETVLAEVRPDLVHAHWTYEFALAAMASGRPCLVTAHDDPLEVLKLMRSVYRFGRYLMAHLVLRNASAVTAVSSDLARRIAPLARAEISVVPNPLSRRFIDAGAHQPVQNRRLSCAIISVINGWGHLKNNRNALIAFARIRHQFPRATYHLYGSDNEPGGAAERWAKSRGLTDGVVFHGLVAHGELVAALQSATLMLHPSRSESCPMGIAEALALGLPIIGGHMSGGVPEMVGDAGLLVDINDSAAIADAVTLLLSNERLYNECSKAAFRRIAALTPEAVVSRYEEIYRRVIDKSENRSPS